jgi:hypothetical protein
MNDCIHFDEARNECGIYSIPCESLSREIKGCYMSIAERDLMLYELRRAGEP